MEATSARWAGQDRPNYSLGGSLGPTARREYTRLEGLIRYACESPNINIHQRFAPENMDAQAAVCDEVNAKKSNAAHFAADLIVKRYINGFRADSAYKALQLLDSCVKNCGDPFHYAISTKEWLNELVRRFGPTPPPKNRVQEDILKLLELWYRTIAQHSFIKDDLAYIRDMHRLLQDKGFSFPRPDADDINALSGLEAKGVQTEEALKDRRNEALHAKLQDLLRRGGMRNLQEANRIMKILSDFDQSDKSEIRQEAADRIADVRERTRVLSERLRAVKPGDQLTSGDAFESLVDELKSEQHKLHNTLQNDRESDDSMQVLLGINEEINHVINWYEALQAGDFPEAKRLENKGPPQVAAIGQGNNSSQGIVELSLIDFEEASTESGTPNAQGDLQDDLLGLALGDTSSTELPEPGHISLGSPAPISLLNQPNLVQAHTLASSTASLTIGANPTIPQQLQQIASSSVPSPNQSEPGTSSSMSRAGLSPTRSTTLAKNSQSTPQKHQESTPQVDPFASIASVARAFPSSSTSSKSPESQNGLALLQSQDQQAPSLAQGSLLDLDPPLESQRPVRYNSMNGGVSDDDWDFSGAPPPEEEDFVVFDDDIKIEFQISRSSDTSLTVTTVFSNNISEPVSKLDFRTGMPKLYPRKIDPISSSRLQPHQSNGAYQKFTIEGVPRGQASHIPRIKWRLSRVINDSSVPRLDQGEAPAFQIG